MRFTITLHFLFVFFLVCTSVFTFAQAPFFANFKKGMKFHYRGTLITDTINDYPTNRPFSQKEYNASFPVTDFVVAVDTVVDMGGIRIVRFTVNDNLTEINNNPKVGVELSFLSSSEPLWAFNLLFYKREIYSMYPSKGLANPIDFSQSPLSEKGVPDSKIDSAIRIDYQLFFKMNTVKNGCLETMVFNRKVIENSRVIMKRPVNADSCNFFMNAFINLSDSAVSNAPPHNDGQHFYKLKEFKTLPGAFGGKTKVFVMANQSRYATNEEKIYLSNDYFISRIFREDKWSRHGRMELRNNPPYKLILDLYKID